jgi:hypothetical protein
MAQEDSGIIFTEDETKKIKDLIDNYCKPVKDYKSGQLVTVNASSVNTIEDPDFKFSELQDIAKNQKALDSKKQQGSNFPSPTQEVSLQSFKTLMFNKEEINMLNKFLAENDNNTEEGPDSNEADYSSYLTSGPGVFRLDSIVHESADRWAVWLNGARYDNVSQENPIKIMTVGSDNATIRWFITNIDRVSPDWQSHVKPIAENKYASNISDVVIEFDDDKTYIFFTLKPGQIFDAHSMKIFETRQS